MVIKMLINEWTDEHLNAIVLNKDFKQWFGCSVVVDKAGFPETCFHYTSSTFDVNDFRPLSHFGTSKAAMKRWQMSSGGDPIGLIANRPNKKVMDKLMKNDNLSYWKNASHQTIPVFLKICNPLKIKDHGDDHRTSDFWYEMFVRKVISKETYNKYLGTIVDSIWKYEPHKQKVAEIIMKHMLDAGYDGFCYKNTVEHVGSTSYIILSPKQVRSVFEFF